LAENGFAGAFSNTTVSAGSSVTYYGNYGNSNNALATAETTEANASLVHRGSNVTLKSLRVIVATNTRAAQSSVTTRLNAADTAQVATITASTTGTYTDLTDTVSVTAGDTVGYKAIVGSTSGNLLISSITANHESAGQAFNFWAAAGSVSSTTASVTRYLNPVGNITAVQTTDANAQTYAPAAGTISNLRIYVTAARATATTVRSRVNAANGAQSVSVTGTGAFEDTSNSDTLAAADLFNYSFVTGTGTDTLTIVGLSYKYTPSTAHVTALGAGPGQSAVLGAGVTRYFVPSGLLLAVNTESQSQIAMPYAGTLGTLSATVSANSWVAPTATATFVLRVGGVDSTLTYAIIDGATGSFFDITNSVSVAAGDLVSIKGSGATASITIRSMGVKLTATASISGTASITEAGDTVSSASTLALKAAAAITEAGDAVSSAATLALKASAAITEANDTLSSASTLALVAALAVTEAGDTLASAAFVTQPAIAAEAAITEANDTLSAASRSRFWSAVSVNSETWSPVAPTAEIWTAA
jgi:hypothetical protein